MGGLITPVLSAAFFYLMMRFGCCAHMVHGHGGHHRDGDERHPDGSGLQMAAKDPAYGIDVQPGWSYVEIHEGRPSRPSAAVVHHAGCH